MINLLLHTLLHCSVIQQNLSKSNWLMNIKLTCLFPEDAICCLKTHLILFILQNILCGPEIGKDWSLQLYPKKDKQGHKLNLSVMQLLKGNAVLKCINRSIDPKSQEAVMPVFHLDCRGITVWKGQISASSKGWWVGEYQDSDSSGIQALWRTEDLNKFSPWMNQLIRWYVSSLQIYEALPHKKGMNFSWFQLGRNQWIKTI